MFFSTYVLTKKGPLAKIWLAAHWDKRLTAKDVKLIDINDTVVHILHPTVPIALRTSGELMLGVVRVYALKVMHLLKDVKDATTILLRPKSIQMIKGKDGKDAAVAVTLDVVIGRVGGERLSDAAFDGIADILSSKASHQHGKASTSADDAAGAASASKDASSWFAVDASQFQDEIRLSVDDLAHLRADMLNFDKERQQRGDSSTSGKKSSLSSVEAGRAGQAGGAADPWDALGLQAAAQDGDLNLDLLLPTGAEDVAPPPLIDAQDPFAFPGDTPAPAAAAGADGAVDSAAAATRAAHRKKLVQVMDASDTMQTNAQMTKLREDRHDIVFAERRHGALDMDEAVDRLTVRNGDGAVISCEPTSVVSNPALRAAFANALRTCVSKAVEAMERARDGGAAAAAGRESRGGPAVFGDDAVAQFATDGEVPAPLFEFDYRADEAAAPVDGVDAETGRLSRKRPRESEGTKVPSALSESVVHTLETVRALLSGKTQTLPFSKLIHGVRRREAARTFVDSLVLASHNFVELSQAAPFADLSLRRTEKLLSSEGRVAAAATA